MNGMSGNIEAIEPGSWKPQRVDLKSVFTELTKAVSKASTGAPLVTTLPDLTAAVSNTGTLPEANRTYILIGRAFLRAAAELDIESQSLFTHSIVADIVFISAEASELEISLAPNFLQRPREINLMQKAQPLLKEWLVVQGMDETQATTTAERLPTYFAPSLHQELTQHSKLYAPLNSMLPDSPHSKIRFKNLKVFRMESANKRLLGSENSF